MEATEQQKQEIRTKGRKEIFDDEVNSKFNQIKPVSNKVRLALLGWLWVEGERNFKEIRKVTNTKSNVLAYHIQYLLKKQLIQKVNQGYDLTVDGAEILYDIGFVRRTELIRKRSLFRKPLYDYIEQSIGRKMMCSPVDVILEK